MDGDEMICIAWYLLTNIKWKKNTIRFMLLVCVDPPTSLGERGELIISYQDLPTGHSWYYLAHSIGVVKWDEWTRSAQIQVSHLGKCAGNITGSNAFLNSWKICQNLEVMIQLNTISRWSHDCVRNTLHIKGAVTSWAIAEKTILTENKIFTFRKNLSEN